MLKMAGPLFLSLLIFGLVFGPLARGGAVLMLDWVVGPRPSLGNLWGFPDLLAGVPFHLSVVGMLHSFPLGVASLVPMAVAIVLASWGILRLTGSLFQGIFAALLFTMNPFVYDRMLAGHIGLLLGYALLPILLSTLLRSRSSVLRDAVWVGLIAVILVALSLHFIFLVGVIFIVVVITSAIRHDRSVPTKILRAGIVIGLLSVYWLIPSVGSLSGLDRVAGSDVRAFRTVVDPQIGLLANASGLYGFWHREWPLPKDGIPGWWVLMLAMFVVICAGAWLGLRDPERKWLSLTLVLCGVAGFFLALGDQGPTGPLFSWMFDHVPGFKIMREPQKFLGLLVIAYAFFYGIGSEWLVNGFRKNWAKAALALLLIALPCIYTYKMFWGFNGYVKPSKFPASWAQADKMMGEGPEKALALPWHLYMSFPWTQDRLVANPLSSYFHRETIVGDNIEVGDIETQSTNPRSKYIEDVMARWLGTKNFGNLVAPMGVRYILLAKEDDWMDYRWLEQQEDIRLVREWEDLRLYENMVAAPTAYSTDRKITFRNMDELVAAAAVIRLTDYAIEIDPSATSPPDLSPANAGPLRVKKHSPVDYELLGSGKGRYTVFTEPFDAEWAIGEERASANLGATNFFEIAPREGMRIKFLRWRLMLVGYSISGATLLAILVYWIRSVVKRRRIVVAKLDPIHA